MALVQEALAAAFAEFEFERDLIRKRLHAGLDRARAEGKRLGRPPLSRETIAEIRSLRRRGLSVRAIAEKLNQSTGVVGKYAVVRAKHRNTQATLTTQLF